MLSRLQSATVAAFTLGAFGLGAVLAPVAAATEADSASTAVVAPAPASVDATTVTGEPAATGQTQKVSTSSRALAVERERNYARGLGLAKDRYGIRPSLYRGAWYSPVAEKHRICIAKRESHGNYKASSSRGIYQGAYQMNRSLARGATWMMQPSVKKLMGAEGVKILTKLRKTPVMQWNRYWQDRAFFTIWRDGRGKSHWHGLCWKSPAQIKAEKIAHAKAVATAKAKAKAKAVAQAKAKAKAKAAAKKKAWAKAHPKAAAKAEAKKKAAAKKKADAKKKSAAKKKAEAKKKSAAKKKAAAKKKQKR